MNTLFAKILLWFGITLFAIIAGFSAITAFQLRDVPQRGAFPVFHMQEALEARARGGDEELKRYLQRFGDVIRNDVYLLDANNRDVLTGEVVDVPGNAFRGRPPLPYWPGRGPQVRLVSVGDARMLMVSRDQPSYTWWLSPQVFWILGVAIALCFGLAAWVSSPLRAMQRVVEEYGEGKLSLRMGSKRRDEFGKLSRAFDQMADRILTLLEAERRLLADISHELRSPLARLSVAAELLDEPEEREGAKRQIKRETERLNQLIGGLLEVTRAEGDPAHLRRDPVELTALLTDIVNDCSYEARERNVEIHYEAPPELVAEGDAELLRRATENVLRNALRYAPPASVVHFSGSHQEDGFVIQIRDAGPGVPEEQLVRIFDPFFRVEDDRNRRQGGTGLGLSIARRAIEVHGGQISASNANPGLLVEIRLPGVRSLSPA
jgi:signal transduction histidine kinase